MRSFLLRSSRLLYSQAPPKVTAFKVPLAHELSLQTLNEVRVLLESSPSCKVAASVFKENIKYFVDKHLSILYRHLRVRDLQIDSSFHQLIAPLSLEYVKLFTREQSLVLGEILQTLVALKIQSKQLFDAVVNKLDNENIYRYLPLNTTLQVLNTLLESQQHAQLPLTRKLITVVYQNQGYYMHSYATRNEVKQVIDKLAAIQFNEPQLTEAYKQLQ